MPQIIGRQKCYKVSLRSSKSQIAGGGGPRVRLKQISNLISLTRNGRCCLIRRAIVGNEDLDRAVGLRQHALNRFPEISLAVVDGNNTAD